MAEIRKYDPAKGNAIAQALRAAMGDPIRPVETWQAPAAAAPPMSSEEQESATSWINLRVDEPGTASSGEQ